MKAYLIILFLAFFLTASFAQDGNNVLVVTKDGTKNIPAYIREGTIYFSLKDFAFPVTRKQFVKQFSHQSSFSNPSNTILSVFPLALAATCQIGQDFSRTIPPLER